MPEWEVLARALSQDIAFDDLFPYSADDVALFLEQGIPEFTYARLERVPTEGWCLCDVLAVAPDSERCMFWQGIRLSGPEASAAGWIAYPSYLRNLPRGVKADLEAVLAKAARSASYTLNSGAAAIVHAELSSGPHKLSSACRRLTSSPVGYADYVSAAKRYMFAAEFCMGKSVLDVGCGVGCGTRMLASEARMCKGFDVSPEAIAFARSSQSLPSLQFFGGDLQSLPFKREFDTVVSFNVIEQVPREDRDRFLDEIVRVLEPGGQLIISTSNRLMSERATGRLNEAEMYLHEFYVLLGRHFGTQNVHLFGQRSWDGGMALACECSISEMPAMADDCHIAVCRKPAESESFRIFPAKTYKASIIIPVRNRCEMTKRCLEAVVSTAGTSLDYEVIIVDNASTDDTSEFLSCLEGDVRVITNNINVGVAAACNQAAEIASGEHLIFLSSTTVPQPGWIEAMIRTADADDDLGIVGAMILSPDRSVRTIGYYFTENGIPKSAGAGLPPTHPIVAESREMQSVSGMCMLVKSWLFRQLAGFAESYFMYHEDVDLCLRAREAKQKVMYCSDARLVQHEPTSSSSSREAEIQSCASLATFLRRWKGRIASDEVEFAGASGATRRRPGPVPLVWHAPVYDPSGYADEARSFIFAIDGRSPLAVTPINWSDKSASLTPEHLSRLKQLTEVLHDSPAVHVWHILPRFFRVAPDAVMNVGRTMFESDRLPESWIEPCNLMDEIWVPCEFNLHTFAASGVARDKLVKIPGGIDLRRFAPSSPPMQIAGRRGFNFLCNLDWRLRKGWDVLLAAYCSEFKASDDVALIIKAYASEQKTPEMIHSEAECFIESLGLPSRQLPAIIFLDDLIPDASLPGLYAAADAYVQPSRGEAWGRTYMEAMAMALPTIATRWSGNLDFMTDENSYLIDCHLVDVPRSSANELRLYQGHMWAEPCVDHLRALMREVYEDRAAASERGKCARADLEANYSYAKIAELVAEHLDKVVGGRSR